MANYKIAWNAATRTATVQKAGDALPAGSSKIKDFVYDDLTTNADDNVAEVIKNRNRVYFHFVRDALYFLGVQDMQRVTIIVDGEYIALTSVSSLPATVTLAPTATQQITNTFNPTDASNKAVVYTTSDATKATVNASGLITAVATGSATITITSNDGNFTDTVVVTVS